MNLIDPDFYYTPLELVNLSNMSLYEITPLRKILQNLNKKLIKGKYNKLTGVWIVKGRDFLEWYNKQ